MEHLDKIDALRAELRKLENELNFEISAHGATIKVSFRKSDVEIVRFRNPDDKSPEVIALKYKEMDEIVDKYQQVVRVEKDYFDFAK